MTHCFSQVSLRTWVACGLLLALVSALRWWKRRGQLQELDSYIEYMDDGGQLGLILGALMSMARVKKGRYSPHGIVELHDAGTIKRVKERWEKLAENKYADYEWKVALAFLLTIHYPSIPLYKIDRGALQMLFENRLQLLCRRYNREECFRQMREGLKKGVAPGVDEALDVLALMEGSP